MQMLGFFLGLMQKALQTILWDHSACIKEYGKLSIYRIIMATNVTLLFVTPSAAVVP